MATKNLGQASGIFIGSLPPENIVMIWYDSTPSQMIHKVYNEDLGQWVPLDKNVISSITYSELIGIATNPGLSSGTWYKITDKSNALAIAITSTKVQYTDSLGNILIDDLAASIQYHVTSSNILIDDVAGVFDVVNKKLVFQFTEQAPDYTANDYLLGKISRNNVWSLAKYRLSSFLSTVTGNSITWNGGFFFNFTSALTNALDRTGGAVAKSTYDIEQAAQNQAINNVGIANQSIIDNAQTALNNATTPTAIYNKAIPTAPTTIGAPTDIVLGDTLHNIISKIQRYINKFKYATGILMTPSFTPTAAGQTVNNNDTVETAIGKIQGNLTKIVNEDVPDVMKKGMYDYVVDSDESLLALLGNLNATSVLIKNGIWTYDFGTDTTDILTLPANIKRIDCQPDAVINIVGSIEGRSDLITQNVLFSACSDKSLLNFKGVKIKMNVTGTASVTALFYVFSYLENLTDCEVLEANISSLGSATGFNYCKNLNNCHVSANVRSTGFWHCNHMHNCSAVNVNLGFYYCDFLTSCSVSELLGSTGYTGYDHCFNLSQCKSSFVVENASLLNISFSYCTNLNLCLSEIQETTSYAGNGIGFDGCSFCGSCTSMSVLPNNHFVKGFKDCLAVKNCNCIAISAGLTFPSSYATSTIVSANECADTSLGGFNSYI